MPVDQLEPLVSQTLAVADRHTAQLRQISITVSHLQEAVGQLLEAGQVQSENMQFVLKELVEVKGAIAVTNAKVDATDVRIDAVDSQVVSLGAKVGTMDAKLDRILDLLSDSK